jgi:hypothetical protein
MKKCLRCGQEACRCPVPLYQPQGTHRELPGWVCTQCGQGSCSCPNRTQVFRSSETPGKTILGCIVLPLVLCGVGNCTLAVGANYTTAFWLCVAGLAVAAGAATIYFKRDQ